VQHRLAVMEPPPLELVVQPKLDDLPSHGPTFDVMNGPSESSLVVGSRGRIRAFAGS
jgi:hypothetical protein